MVIDTNDLLAALLHEMKNNLGLLALSLDEMRTRPGGDHTTQLEASRLLCERVIDRLRQTLLLYKNGNDRFVLNVDAHPVRDFLRELAQTADSLASGRLIIEARQAEDAPELWFFDRNLVHMAMVSAIHNSIQYAAARIRIEAGLTEGMLRLTVRDDSPGYPPHILECVAQDRPFSTRGTGLGLTFAKLIAQAHENRGRYGRLQLDNAAGAVFSLLLP